MSGEHAVGRVIARPFRGEPGAFERTHGAQATSRSSPPWRSYMQELQADGVPVHTVGKIGQVFAGVGVDESHKGATNRRRSTRPRELIDELDGGFVFTNLVETDQVYGHRGDVPGFHAALREIDAAVGRWLERLDPERDLLVITADHGCDPTTPGTDHTREHVPLLARFDGHGAAATTVRSPTSAPRCCSGWPAATPRIAGHTVPRREITSPALQGVCFLPACGNHDFVSRGCDGSAARDAARASARLRAPKPARSRRPGQGGNADACRDAAATR